MWENEYILLKVYLQILEKWLIVWLMDMLNKCLNGIVELSFLKSTGSHSRELPLLNFIAYDSFLKNYFSDNKGNIKSLQRFRKYRKKHKKENKNHLINPNSEIVNINKLIHSLLVHLWYIQILC